MKIVFFATKPYDSQSFSQIAAQYPQLELEYWDTLQVSEYLEHYYDRTRPNRF